MGIDVILATLLRLAADAGHQRVVRLLGQLGARQSNCRERWLRELAHIDVIKTDYGNVFRDVEFRFVYGAKRTNGGEIIGGQHGRGPHRSLEQLLHGCLATIDFMVARLDYVLIRKKPVVLKPLHEDGTSCLL